MNFQAHLQGGLVAGSIAVGVALGTGYAEWQSDAWQRFLDQPLDFGQPISLLLSLFVTAVFMALFPDLDTTSVPQRWFFRAMFVMLAILYFQKELEKKDDQIAEYKDEIIQRKMEYQETKKKLVDDYESRLAKLEDES
ncbi:MAG: hypothetical protein VXW13_05320, partial [SAR324 cluster bacterium]|nr:hypothetical protein [SAR324 cluster bacterium]